MLRCFRSRAGGVGQVRQTHRPGTVYYVGPLHLSNEQHVFPMSIGAWRWVHRSGTLLQLGRPAVSDEGRAAESPRSARSARAGRPL
jgi:hypothetical protein